MTDESVPAVKMYNANAAGSKKLQKAITNIQMTDDGLISFDFMGGDPSAIISVASASAVNPAASATYDLQGRRVVGTPRRGLYIREGKIIQISK